MAPKDFGHILWILSFSWTGACPIAVDVWSDLVLSSMESHKWETNWPTGMASTARRGSQSRSTSTCFKRAGVLTLTRSDRQSQQLLCCIKPRDSSKMVCLVRVRVSELAILIAFGILPASYRGTDHGFFLPASLGHIQKDLTLNIMS